MVGRGAERGYFMINKVRFIEAGNYAPYKRSLLNFITYNRYLKNPSTGLLTLTTIVKRLIDDTLMYSESISETNFEDLYDADIVFFSINTFNAVRSYEIAEVLKANSEALIVFGGMHASLNYREAIDYCDYILTGDADDSIVDFIRAINKGLPLTFAGLIYKSAGEIVDTGRREQPENIDTIPDRNLLYNYSKMAKRYDTLWPQVHASRGCPHNCSYCSVIAHFGRKLRKRSPDNVVDDIKQAIEFHRRRVIPRLSRAVWITDDNFAHDREWAIEVLKGIINSGIKYFFTVQARFEIGFDDELLALMKKAGFFEVAIGIEFLDDESFKQYNKKSNYDEIRRAIKNIRRHGIGVRGLFIVGTEYHRRGIGRKIARYVKDNGLHGALIQSLFFTPGTEFYEQNRERLIHRDWDKYDGRVVHYPANMRPQELQEEVIIASKKIYSFSRLLKALFTYSWFNKLVFAGEFFWHMSLRSVLKREAEQLKQLESDKSQTVISPINSFETIENHSEATF